MAPIIFLFFILATFLTNPFSLLAHKPHNSSRISVVGCVYCDTCSTKTFSKHSYVLLGVDVHIQCKFKANSPRTAEQINFTVNRTTDKYGIYKLEIANIDGVDCRDNYGSGIEFMCQATVIKSSNSACKIPQLRTTTDQITIKSKQDNHCIYCLNALSYKPKTRNESLCSGENELENFTNSLNSSKFFFPFLPPNWPPYTTLPPFPFFPFPPFTYPQPPPSLPFPFPPFTYPQPPPSLPFPFPPFPPPPVIFRPPPPPGFNLGDPTTWIPHVPVISPPPPPAFNLGDPRTWVPYYFPPSPPPNRPQNHNP